MVLPKKAIIFLAIITTGLLVQAHEFWMQPRTFRYAPGETAILNFMVGENFVGEYWNLKKNRVIRLDHFTRQDSKSLLNEVNEETGRHLAVKLSTAGTHLVVMQSTSAFLELEAEAFNDYLKEDGLDNVLDHRKRTHTLDKPSREFYARCAKVLLQAGTTTDDTYRKVTGQPLEIIPVQNPYALNQGDEMSFRVLFEGKPSPFTLVKVWNRKNNNTILQNIYTQKDGVITTRLGNTGSWMVSCVKLVPSKEEGADWQSYWASLIFGFEP